MILTWRGRAARLHNWFDAGEGFLAKIRNLLVIGAALKIFGMSTWLISALSPLLVVAYIVVGWAWIRWGWYRQLNETTAIDTWDPVKTYQLHALARLLRSSGQRANGFDLTTLPEELRDSLSSTRKGPR